MRLPLWGQALSQLLIRLLEAPRSAIGRDGELCCPCRSVIADSCIDEARCSEVGVKRGWPTLLAHALGPRSWLLFPRYHMIVLLLDLKVEEAETKIAIALFF